MDTRIPVPILLPKVQVPPSRLRLVSRRRLLQVLDEGLHRKLTLISAPAGYGKSTLLSEWAAACGWSLGWVTLETGDNDLERFLAYLISAIQIAEPGLSTLENLLGTHFSLQPLPPEAILTVLVNQLSSVSGRLVVVLDDYHLIDNPEIHGFLTALLDNLPPNVHFMISTRVDPPLRLARLRAKDQLNEITERDLRFTLPEAETFLEAVMDLALSRDQIAELEARTEGWVTGLQLAGLSLKDRERPGELIQSLAGTHRYILDYLVEEVFSDLPPLLQTFLLRISILERLSPALCDAVAGMPDAPLQSKNILESLDSANLFVVPLDSQRQWYRFHSLFAEFLQDRLESEAADELPDLHRRAAAWYEQHDLIREAIQHSFASGDVDRTADLIQSQAKDLLGRGEIRTLNHWIDALPEEAILARPQLGLARAWATLMRNPPKFWSTADQRSRQIAEGFGIVPQDLLAALAESEPGSQRRAGLAEFAMLQAFAFRERLQIPETIRLFQATLDFLPESELLLRGFTLAGLASTYTRMGAIKPAEETFAQAAQISLAANSIYGYVACTDWQATMQAEQGLLAQAAATYRQAIETLSSQGQRPLPLSGHVYVGLASVLLERNDLEAALEAVRTGLQIGDQVRDMDALLKGYTLLAQTSLALGRREAALQALAEAERVARDTLSAGCLQETQAWAAQVALAAGDVQEALRWAQARGLGEAGQAQMPGDLAEVEQLTFARLQMATGKVAGALPILQERIGLQEQAGRTRALIESLALQALCLRSLGRSEEAAHSLARALLLAEPEGFVRVFLQEGPPLAALLRAIAAQGHSPDYARRLLEAFGETPTQEALLDPLSERELEVLRLVAEGFTNLEIAENLVIAHSTVKTHINRIYTKLGVNNRTQAVARARQLQILA